MSIRWNQALELSRKDRKTAAARLKGETIVLTHADIARVLSRVSSVDLTEGRLGLLRDAVIPYGKTGKARLSRDLLKSLQVEFEEEDEDVVPFGLPLLGPALTAFGIGMAIGMAVGDAYFARDKEPDTEVTVTVETEDGDVEINEQGEGK